MGGAVIIIISLSKISEQSVKPPFYKALKKLPSTLDPIGFILFAGAVTMLLLALSWGGSQFSWSSATIIGLLCGGLATMLIFCGWVWFKREEALIMPSSLSRRSIYVGVIVIFFQGGASQAVPFFLPLWFQAIKGDSASESAVHLLPSLVTMVLGIVLYGSLVRKLRYIPPWGILGSLIASIGSGLCVTLAPNSSVGQWVGYQILTNIGRGMAVQVVSCHLFQLTGLSADDLQLSSQG
jgi:predicted neutral ceramidase superfamily lipid hydrolase